MSDREGMPRSEREWLEGLRREQRLPEGALGDASDPRLMAALDLLRRTGASSFQIRYSDDQEPVVWVAICAYSAAHLEKIRQRAGRSLVAPPSGSEQVAVAAGLTPLAAVFRLCDDLIDGGECVHCHRPAGFAVQQGDYPLDTLVCWQQFDPELRTFRRSCEGSR